MKINEAAPAVTHESIEVSASPDAVWAVLSDIARWPEWNSDVKTASIDGELIPGTTFSWQAGPGTINSTLREVDRPHLLGWTGRTFGIKAIHIYRVDATSDGTTVTSQESWDGLLVRLLHRPMQKMLDRSTRSGLSQLKAAVEL